MSSNPSTGPACEMPPQLSVADPCNKTAKSEYSFKAPSAESELLLVIDDDHGVRRSIKRLLESQGYHVIDTATGTEGIVIFRERHAEIRLVIIDMVMPLMNGRQVHDFLVDIKPGVRVIFMSGYPEDEFTAKGLMSAGFICKPVSPDEMLHAIKSAIDC